MERPPWAHTLGRDQDGLFVGFDDGRGDRRAYWAAPGSLADGPEQGCFMDEAQYRALRLPGPGNPRSRQGDEYGVYLDIAIGGITLRLRWIWPGRFLMGSPATENGRFDDETQHEVILTRGYWLAETACTQGLWRAVMGENPSYSKGPQRPVEQVSWEDVQGFLGRLNAEVQHPDVGRASGPGIGLGSAPPGRVADERPFAIVSGADQARSGAAVGEGRVGLKPDLHPDLNPDPQPMQFRLPTEAEWEFACRAGTETAYSFGDAFDPKLANSGDRTVDVRSLPPSPWGLYEMHGNVYEWCQDWFGDYPAGPVVDPGGPTAGVRRVLRGGSWLSGARGLRSAYRSGGAPGDRGGDIGFRLALGPELRPEGQAGKAGSGAGQPGQGASGSERKAV